MEKSHSKQILDIGRLFSIDGQFLSAESYGTGHINETFISAYQTVNGIRKYIHQRLNHQVFKEPVKVMENIERVTRHIYQKVISMGGDPERQCLSLVPSSNGIYYSQSLDGSYWRTYRFIDGASTYDLPQSPMQVYAAAKAYGDYQKMLTDMPGLRLHETIPDFHNTPLRYQSFLNALNNNINHRVENAQEEINFILDREPDTRVVITQITDHRIPERVTHNDTKLNNVLIDDCTGEGICVIDLDTTMPGSCLYDFGDMVRSGTITSAEDEPDLAKVHLDVFMFEQVARGYIEATQSFLTPAELSLLAFSGKLITFEQAIRFLTDYLNGDKYYKIKYPEHNLHRARTQIKLVSEIERQMTNLEKIIDKYT
jgi:aminoglycoside phosphotransferase (APT) family kinase protein